MIPFLIHAEVYKNENPQNFNGGHAYFVGNIPVSAAR